MAVIDVCFEFAKQLSQGRAQRVIGGVRHDVRPGRDELGRDAEGGTLLESALDEHASFVDLEGLPQRFDALFDQRDE